jgi:hypothetical protein
VSGDRDRTRVSDFETFSVPSFGPQRKPPVPITDFFLEIPCSLAMAGMELVKVGLYSQPYHLPAARNVNPSSAQCSKFMYPSSSSSPAFLSAPRFS